MARIFSAKFRRQLSLNFAAQSAAAVLNHQHLVNAMCHDWNNFDVDGILDQTLWVCDCDTHQIKHICKRMHNSDKIAQAIKNIVIYSAYRGIPIAE